MAPVVTTQGRSRFAVFVDAGYLIAAGAWTTIGSERRADSVVRIPELLDWMKAESTVEADGRELLRVYWYDAAPQQVPTPEQWEVRRQFDTKLRLGSLNRSGQQKGVDALLLADMMDLATSRSVDLVVLVSGDEDLAEAVRRVQAAGIRLHLWGVESPKNTVSFELRDEADRWRLLTADELRPFFLSPTPSGRSRDTSPPPPSLPQPARPKWLDLPLSASTPSQPGAVTVGGAALRTYADVDRERAAEEGRRFAADWAREATPDDLDVLRGSARPSIPYQIDARLLTTSCRNLGLGPEEQLDYEARTALRDGFWVEVERLQVLGPE